MKENDMTDQTKFEEMLEKLVNEDREGAEALFHEIVVEKSREIYTNILDEADEEVEETTDEEVDESDDEDLDETTDEEVDEAADEEVEESKNPKSAGEEMREYVEKVSAKMGDNGANTKSTVASPNNMGGDASNLVQGAEESGGEHAGLGDASPKDQDGGNVNVPGGKASKSLKAQPGHGAEKKGKPEAAADKKSTIGS